MNKCVLISFLNCSILSINLTFWGKLFQRDGAADAKALSPKVFVLVLGGSSRFVFVFRVVIDELFVSSLISSDKYCGASPCRALKVRSRIL